jgi:hypothetical protein
MTIDTNGNLGVGTITVSNITGMYNTAVGSSALAFGGFDMEDFLDTHSFNKITVDHKVSEFELMKLKETVPTYADEIKENLSKNLARDIIKKTTFTKKHDKDADVHHFLGRVWVFTEDELTKLINEARNA